jgi:7-carboxy-7-deazaguanine synthase
MTHLTREQIATGILSLNCKKVTFTGGEPLGQGLEMVQWFIRNFRDIEVNIETNGSMDVKEFCRDYQNVIVTMDYKCPSSGMTDKMRISNLQSLTNRDALKFVVADDKDLQEVVQVLMEHKPSCQIYVSPVFGQMDLQRLAKFVIDHDFLGIKIGLQIHKIIWDPSTRGV